ncbi:FAD:protein FMN transferase [Spongisporangium articulatum]|uniref:FAD:protein FMN transferase n=1 Tax=Spongisporangium articulatum TaxID=3362603 RepID=A0ABW8AJJ8_9ACTN
METLPVPDNARQWPVWGTVARVLVTDPDLADDAAHLVREQLAWVDAAASRFRADSELMMLPRSADGGVDTQISPVLADLVHAAITAARLSDGDVDPTLADALHALGYTEDFAAVAAREPALGVPVTVVRRVHAPVAERVLLDGHRLRLAPGVRLDLGATAKARAADLAAARVHAQLGTGVLVSLGGDLATAGPSPALGWQVRVQDGADQPATVVALHGGGLATSSTLSRRWRHGTRLVHHILDPRTGLPAEPVWRTVSVAAASCVAANTATTAALVRGAGAVARLRRAGGPARLVHADGSVVTLQGWPAEPRRAA